MLSISLDPLFPGRAVVLPSLITSSPWPSHTAIRLIKNYLISTGIYGRKDGGQCLNVENKQIQFDIGQEEDEQMQMNV